MANQVLVGASNNLAASINSTSKTIAITGCNGFDLVFSSLAYIWDTTATKAIPLTYLTGCAMTRSSGAPVFTYTFTQLPSGVTTGDTLQVYLNIPKQFLDYLPLQKLASV
jgi:hypothetical protein